MPRQPLELSCSFRTRCLRLATIVASNIDRDMVARVDEAEKANDCGGENISRYLLSTIRVTPSKGTQRLRPILIATRVHSARWRLILSIWRVAGVASMTT